MKINVSVFSWALLTVILTPFSSLSAAPQIETPLVPPYRSNDFSMYLANQELRLESNLQRLPADVKQKFDSIIKGPALNVSNPKALSQSELAEIFCHIGRDSTPQFLIRRPVFACSESGETISESPFAIDSPVGFGIKGKKFAEFMYFLNLNPPSFANWHRAKILDFLSFALESGASDLPDLTFFEKFLEGSLYRRFATDPLWKRLGRSALAVKSVAIPEGIGYFKTESGLEVAEDLAGLTQSGGFPSVHSAATCAGTCVALEASSFAAVIGKYSYAWQILFYSDVWPDLLSDENGYRAIGNRGSNSLWFVWGDFVAGSDASETLRATQFFKKSLDPFVKRLK